MPSKQPPVGPPTTRQVQCANSDCGEVLTISEPADDGWDAMTEPNTESPGRESIIVGWRIVVKCTKCGNRTAIIREDVPQ